MGDAQALAENFSSEPPSEKLEIRRDSCASPQLAQLLKLPENTDSLRGLLGIAFVDFNPVDQQRRERAEKPRGRKQILDLLRHTDRRDVGRLNGLRLKSRQAPAQRVGLRLERRAQRRELLRGDRAVGAVQIERSQSRLAAGKLRAQRGGLPAAAPGFPTRFFRI